MCAVMREHCIFNAWDDKKFLIKARDVRLDSRQKRHVEREDSSGGSVLPSLLLKRCPVNNGVSVREDLGPSLGFSWVVIHKLGTINDS